MNTATDTRVPIIPPGDYTFCLEDLELAFKKTQLKDITKLWNEGASIEFISKEYKRHPDEVFLALFHQARRGVIKRAFAYQKKEKKK
ncbi:hypothetical protein [Terrihalobacillus insolitus]|uniref:hypothetical protein n=1 Tax=Terrihalobacillus insolitus TaxID=2950438 RepID=UPI00234034BB|nr:hypothetical protein [Terrihalobacillus insolitus]MDC3414293.1 hypothetical protein [Terrihalobacillus insolitus]